MPSSVGTTGSAVALLDSLLRTSLVAFDERNPNPLENLGTLGSAGDAVATGTVRLAPSSTAYVWVPEVVGNHLSVPNGVTPTGDIEFIARMEVSGTTGGYMFGNFDGSNGAFSFGIDGSNIFVFLRNNAGVNSVPGVWNRAGTIAAVANAGQNIWYRLTRTASTGVWTLEVSADQSAVPSSWTLLTNVAAAGPTGTLNGTGTWRIGRDAAPWQGRIYYWGMRRTIGSGAYEITVDTSVLTDEGATWFLAPTGQTVTINRSTGATYKTEVVAAGTGSRLFNGTSDLLTVADLAGLDFGPASPFTVWAFLRQWGTPVVNSRFISKSIGGGAGYVLAVLTTTTAQAYVQGSAGSAFATTNLGAAGSLSLLALARPASGAQMRINVNGTEVSAADTSTDLSNTNELTVGADPGGASRGCFRLYAWGVRSDSLTVEQLLVAREALLVPERQAA